MVNLGLAYWHDAIADRTIAEQRATLAFLAAQPGFEGACRQSIRNSLARHSPAMKVLRDFGSSFYGVFMLYLDARGGLTPTGIHELCKELGVASLGRVTAIMLHLRMNGLVKRDETTTDKRVKRYVPAEEMKAWIVDGLRGELLAFANVEPEARRAAERLADPEALRLYLLALGATLTNTLRRPNQTALTHFAERNDGTIVLWDILNSAAETDTYPPKGLLHMSVHGLARKYKVSRTHVFNLLHDAETKGLLKRNGDDQTGILCESLREALTHFHASCFLGFAMCAHRMLQAADATRGRMEPTAAAS